MSRSKKMGRKPIKVLKWTKSNKCEVFCADLCDSRLKEQIEGGHFNFLCAAFVRTLESNDIWLSTPRNKCGADT